MLYRILTEDKNREGIVDIIKIRFAGFTLIPAIGYWQGIKENSLIIEIEIETLLKYHENSIHEIARQIKVLNNQQVVMVQRIDVKSGLI